MRIKDIQDENFQDYAKTSMFIATCRCSWKCCFDVGADTSLCQNSATAKLPTIDLADYKIVDRYMSNPITHAIVIGGLEPIDQFDELVDLIRAFREKTDDDIVIYSGYYKNEIEDKIEVLSHYKNIIVKFGRYVPNKEKVFDNVLGVYLANEEQHAERISSSEVIQ